MENNKCKAFIECIERGSISAAADSLGYTPSAISQLITSLEKELGLKLLVRSQKGVKPTSEGETLLPAFRSYIAREQDIYHIASELKGVVTGNLSIAAYPSVATNWLPEIVRRFKSEYPGIHINIRESIRENMFQNFEQNTADMGIMVYSEPMPYEWIPLIEIPVLAALPEDHPLAGAEKFPIKECENSDFILGSWGREVEILDILEKNDTHPDIKYTTYDTPATLAMVRMGLGISLVNELSARYWNEHLVKLPLDPPQTVTFGVAVPSREHMTNAAKKFLQFAIDFIEE
ncbi:MAG: LysR family transcriptional regulator [Mogibacterium sp.]|nr:LysR family transcriptional regulator [Mogibacterium sp.]